MIGESEAALPFFSVRWRPSRQTPRRKAGADAGTAGFEPAAEAVAEGEHAILPKDWVTDTLAGRSG